MQRHEKSDLYCRSAILASLDASSSPFSRGRGMDRKLEEPARRQVRALAQCAELLPHHLLGDVGHAGGGLEAAVGAGDDPARVADGLRGAVDAVGAHLRVLAVAGGGVDHASYGECVRGSWAACSVVMLVRA